jgi:glucose-1-phosphate thymidylyltransferase
VRVNGPVRVEEGVTLENVELGPNVTVESGSTIRNATLADTLVGRQTEITGSRLHGSVIGTSVTIRNVAGAVNVGDHSELIGDDKS